LLKSYIFPGESKGRLGSETIRGKARGLKANIEEKAADAFDDLLESNPQLKEGLMWGILKKTFGLELPQESDPLDDVLSAEIQQNPEYRKAAIEAKLKAMGAKVNKDDDRDDIEKGIELLQKLQTLREAAGLDEKDNSWGGIVREAVKAFASNINPAMLSKMISTEPQDTPANVIAAPPPPVETRRLPTPQPTPVPTNQSQNSLL
jgi:hypothetical protein